MSKHKIRLRKSVVFNLQRKIISYKVTESWQSVPHVSYLYEPDITDFYREYKTLTGSGADLKPKITLNTIMIRAIIEGLESAPELNSLISYHHKKGEGMLHICKEINISVPWLLPNGSMISPTLFNTESMSLKDLSTAVMKLGEKLKHTDIDEVLYKTALEEIISELKHFHLGVIRKIFSENQRARKNVQYFRKEREDFKVISKKNYLTAQDFSGGTVTISNIGSLYKEQTGAFGLLEIIPPQIFAVGLGAIQEKPGVYINTNGYKEIGIRKVLPLCLVFDHRAVDFSTLVPFLKRMDKIFSKPEEIYNW
jgi:Pyruvate/2-oxoglutarate dehydrogenase complex, dihydrolipoamide acyltransferase (E2) component, and related enzymes